MAQLGYTFYAKDWFTSNTRKRLKRFPLVRYTIRELIDLMNIESGPIEMNRDYLIDDLDIELNDKEFEKLMEYVEVQEDGRWWLTSIKKRITKAEAARENGKKGGRPRGSKKTQKPREKTQEENPKNPPLERERERESKREIESKIKEKGNESRALDFLNKNYPSRFETQFLMRYKNKIQDIDSFIKRFNNKVDTENLEYTDKILFARLDNFADSWIKNQKEENINSTAPKRF